jgi:hypothetical protein
MCLSLYDFSIDAYERLRSYNGIKLFETQPEEFAGEMICMAELQEALNKWNCVCGPIPTESDDFQYGIKFIFLDDPVEFERISNGNADPRETPAFANVSGTERNALNNTCEPNDDITVYFNVTPQFLYDMDQFPENLDAPFKVGWVNQKYIGNVEGLPKPNTLTLFSVLQVAMHEIGHLLGFGHYTKSATGGFISCDGTLVEESVMKNSIGDIRSSGNNLTELTLLDKCMIGKLYCNNVSIYEYQPPTQKIFPNPSEHLVTINFELSKHTVNLKMTIKDVLGQTLITPIENGIYDAGEQSVQISVEKLPVGVYYIIIEAGTYLTAQPLTIAR